MSYTPPPPPPPPDDQSPGGYGTPPVPPPPPYGGGGYPGPPQSNQKALWSLIIGSLSIPLGCCACLGLVGIVAIVLGGSAKKEIAASGGMQTGAGQAKAGVITGWIGTVLGIIVLGINIAMIASGNGTFDYNFDTTN